MNNIDRDKLLLEYEKLIDRLIRAEKWADDNNYTWEFVKASKYKIWHERDNIIVLKLRGKYNGKTKEKRKY